MLTMWKPSDQDDGQCKGVVRQGSWRRQNRRISVPVALHRKDVFSFEDALWLVGLSFRRKTSHAKLKADSAQQPLKLTFPLFELIMQLAEFGRLAFVLLEQFGIAQPCHC